MRKRFFALMVICIMAVVCFTGCGSATPVVGAPGADGANGMNGTNGTDGANGKSAYELFQDANPWYEGSEAQWLDDLASGILAPTKEYSIVSYGRNLAATVENNGTVSYDTPSATARAAVCVSNAVLVLQTPVILPLGENAEWTVSLCGTISAQGGQFLTSLANGTEGRVYFGVNRGNSILFIGVFMGGYYANYCWSVDQATIDGNHTYDFSYANGEYLLSIDGGTVKHFSTVNIDQSNHTPVTDPKAASAELTSKIRAITGQAFVKMTHIGASTHKCTLRLESFHVTASCVYGYKELAFHPLRNRTVYYLGSSVTRGHGGDTDGTSFADLTATLTGNAYVKEAISGTCLATVSGRTNSYTERLANLDLSKQPSAVVVQLSTNDFSNNIQIGSIGAGLASSSFDTSTITGAIEYIVAKIHESTPSTKVIIYTCTVNSAYAKYNAYKAYVDGTLKQLQAKWTDTLTVLDLLNSEYVNVATYMQPDGVHPNKAGFGHVYMPAFINLLTAIL